MSNTDRMSIEEFRTWANNRLTERDKTTRRHPGEPEHELQVACVSEFRLRHPELADLLIAIPNGGHRNVVTASKLKAEGVVSGVPDLMLCVPRGKYHGMFIEMKNGHKNQPSENQKRMMRLLSAQGYYCTIARSRDDFFTQIIWYINNN